MCTLELIVFLYYLFTWAVIASLEQDLIAIMRPLHQMATNHPFISLSSKTLAVCLFKINK